MVEPCAGPLVAAEFADFDNCGLNIAATSETLVDAISQPCRQVMKSDGGSSHDVGSESGEGLLNAAAAYYALN